MVKWVENFYDIFITVINIIILVPLLIGLTIIIYTTMIIDKIITIIDIFHIQYRKVLASYTLA